MGQEMRKKVEGRIKGLNKEYLENTEAGLGPDLKAELKSVDPYFEPAWKHVHDYITRVRDATKEGRRLEQEVNDFPKFVAYAAYIGQLGPKLHFLNEVWPDLSKFSLKKILNKFSSPEWLEVVPISTPFTPDQRSQEAMFLKEYMERRMIVMKIDPPDKVEEARSFIQSNILRYKECISALGQPNAGMTLISGFEDRITR